MSPHTSPVLIRSLGRLPVGQEQVRALELHFGRDATLDPVLDSLNPALAVAKLGGDLSRAAKGFDDLSVCSHDAPLHTMFSRSVNTALINKSFNPETIAGMDESMKRLFDCARDATRDTDRPITTFADLGARLDESSAVISNWKTRGVSKDGAIKAEREFGCFAVWLLDGKAPGQGLTRPTDELSSKALQFAREYDKLPEQEQWRLDEALETAIRAVKGELGEHVPRSFDVEASGGDEWEQPAIASQNPTSRRSRPKGEK